MGTNYYLHTDNACPHCGREYEPLHIGKSSVGWCFSLHVYPDKNIRDLEDWRTMWADPNAVIRNEYGVRFSPDEMLRVITERGRDRDWEFRPSTWYADEAEFHRKNNSQRGPRGLLRAQIGQRCIAHGEGTWDCIVRDFS